MTEQPTRWTALRSLLFLLIAGAIAFQACYVESPILIIGDDGEEVAEAVRSVLDADVSNEPSGAVRGAEVAAPEGSTASPAEPSEPGTPEPPEEVSLAEVELPPPPEEPESRSMDELSVEPTFTPFTVAPQIVNRQEVVEAMQENYPPLLRDAGIGGTIQVYFFIDEEGSVRDFRINDSSGHEPLDQAALAVADVYRFKPAMNRDEPVPVWVSFPITFQVR